jgi:hypothetical protein
VVRFKSNMYKRRYLHFLSCSDKYIKIWNYFVIFLFNKNKVFCDFPTNILNAIPNVQVSNQSKYKIGTDVEYQCDIGYMPENENSNKITCLTTGKWSELKFKCSSNLFYI